MTTALTDPMSHEWSWSNQKQFTTDTKTAKALLDELLSQLGNHGWTDQEVFGIHLATEEALMNAIKHGNQLDTSKQVEIGFHISPSLVQIEIKDEGSGFDPADVPDPTDDENLEIPSGRGLMLMKSFMSKVEFNPTGNRVVMQKEKGHEPDFDD